MKRLALSCAFTLTLLIGIWTFETVWECCRCKKYFHVQLKKVEYPLHFSVQSPFNTLQRLHNLWACFTFKDYCKLCQWYVIYWVVLFNALGHLPGVKQQKGACYCMFIHLNLWLLWIQWKCRPTFMFAFFSTISFFFFFPTSSNDKRESLA